MKMAARLEAMGQELYVGLTKPSKAGAVWTGVMRQAPDHVLLAPLRRKIPTTYFVNSMSDLFHESVPDEWIDKVFAVMALSPQHTFQVLTKRAQRMRDYCSDATLRDRISRFMWKISERRTDHLHGGYPLRNVWLGVSTERQQEADERIPLLLQTPAAIRFISAEPLLGPINLGCIRFGASNRGFLDARNGRTDYPGPNAHPDLAKLNWVIVGGESGPKARPMHPAWARSLRDQCKAAGVPLFFKQWGNWKPLDQFETQVINSAGKHAVVREDGRFTIDTDIADPPRAVFTFNMGKKGAGRLLDGVEHDGMPG